MPTFLCSLFIMSQDMMTIASSPLMVLCSGTSSVTTTVMVAPAMVGPPAVSGQQDVVLPPSMLLREARDVVGLVLVLQQPPLSQVPFQDISWILYR